MGFRDLLSEASNAYQPLGFDAVGLLITTQPNHRIAGDLTAVTFMLTTQDPEALGRGGKYLPEKRQALLRRAYETLCGAAADAAGGGEVLLDAYPLLSGPSAGSASPPELPAVSFPDPVEMVPVETALADGLIEEGGLLYKYCMKYDLSRIAMQGKHLIGPDVISPEALEALADAGILDGPVLELGGGAGTCGAAARMRGVRDYTFVDNSQNVCGHLVEKFPGYSVVRADAMDFPLEREYSAALVGLSYEIAPWLLQAKGEELADHARAAVFQSACRAFYAFEHDWLMGRVSGWPWSHEDQSLAAHFPFVKEFSFLYQTAAVGFRDKDDLDRFSDAAAARGFGPVSYEMFQAIP